MDQNAKCYSGVVEYERQDPSSIRMVVLSPGDPNKPLSARLESICLDSIEETKHAYHALSYTWSSEDRVVPMLLNGKPIRITRQLGDLFHEVRKTLGENRDSRWWVDQICINQDDDEDKAQQIPHMRAIYEKATFTIALLRPSFEGSQLAVDLLSRLDALSQQAESGYMLNGLPLSQILGPPTEENLRAWYAFSHLMSHKYWTRTWILPEATARPANCWVVCDKLEDAFNVRRVFWIRNIVQQLWTRGSPPEYLLDHIPSALVGRVEMFDVLRRSSQAKGIALFDLLYIARRTECTAPEDKIFAMLPFATDVGDYTNDKYIRPSYAWGCAGTYTRLVKWYITRYLNLDFLGSCASTKPWTTQVPDLDLPMWVPDWTHASFIRPLARCQNPQAPIEDRLPLYSACGPFSHSFDIVEPPSAEYETNLLFLSGLRVAVVHKVFEPANDGDPDEPATELSWQDGFDSDAKYPLTTESCKDAFERTIVADTTRDSSSGVFSRPGKVKWWHDDVEIGSEEGVRREQHLRFISRDRKLFFASSDRVEQTKIQKADEDDGDDSTSKSNLTHQDERRGESFLMGLGRSDIAVGDEIWALKGGQVLYVLRPQFDLYTMANVVRADDRDPHWPDRPSMLWLSGKRYQWDEVPVGPCLTFVGECYVHGLMDGEALEYASLQPDDRPETVRDMSSGFKEIFVG